MNESNKLIFKRCDYRDIEEFYDTLFKQIRILIETNNVFSFHENPQSKGVYALQFGPSQIDENGSYPIWLNGREILYVTQFARQLKYQDAQDYINDFDSEEELDDEFNIKIKPKKDDGGKMS